MSIFMKTGDLETFQYKSNNLAKSLELDKTNASDDVTAVRISAIAERILTKVANFEPISFKEAQFLTRAGIPLDDGFAIILD